MFGKALMELQEDIESGIFAGDNVKSIKQSINFVERANNV